MLYLASTANRFILAFLWTTKPTGMKKTYLMIWALVFFTAAVYAQTPYASYPLDGNAQDVSGNNLHGTISGNPSATTNRYNQSTTAMVFNGVSDYINLPSAFDYSTRSVLVWFNASQIGSANGYNVVYMSDGPHLQYGLTNITLYTDGTFGDVVRINVGGEVFNANINTNQWYQVAISRTPSVVKFYLNGTMVYSQNNPGIGISNNTVATTAVVGADRGYSAKFFGKIDDLRIYNAVISDSAVAEDYTTHFTVYDTTHVTVNDTTHFTVYDTTYVTINDTAYVSVYDTTFVSVSVTDTLKINVNLTGIAPPNNTNQLSVYPNPANDHLVINNGNLSSMSGYSIKITNALGQVVFNQLVNQQQFYLDLATWGGNGVYILYVLDAGQNVISVKQIVLQ